METNKNFKKFKYFILVLLLCPLLLIVGCQQNCNYYVDTKDYGSYTVNFYVDGKHYETLTTDKWGYVTKWPNRPQKDKHRFSGWCWYDDCTNNISVDKFRTYKNTNLYGKLIEYVTVKCVKPHLGSDESIYVSDVYTERFMDKGSKILETLEKSNVYNPNKYNYTHTGLFLDQYHTWCCELKEQEYSSYNSTIKTIYDDCNPFAIATGKFGDIKDLTVHETEQPFPFIKGAITSLGDSLSDFINSYKPDAEETLEWCSETTESGFKSSKGYEFNVCYDDCNPFHMIDGTFGDLSNLAKHTEEPASEEIVSSFNSLSAEFDGFIKNFTIPAQNADFSSTSITGEALTNYIEFYNTAISIYNNSNVPFTKNVKPNFTKGAVIGLNYPYAMLVDNETFKNVNLQLLIANLFGYKNISDLVYYAKQLKTAYSAHRTSALNEALNNGCFYTQNGSFVFPIAIKNNDTPPKYSDEIRNIILTYIIIDTNGLVSVWIHDLDTARYATKFDYHHDTYGEINNKLYCKNTLFIKDPKETITSVADINIAKNQFSNIYENAIEIYTDSLSEITRTPKNDDEDTNNQNQERDVTKGAIIGLNYPLAFVYSSSGYDTIYNYRKAVAKLFGFNYSNETEYNEFLGYVDNLANIYKKHRENLKNKSSNTNYALNNGCLYSEDGTFIFPMAIKNDYTPVVLTYLIIDPDNHVYVWYHNRDVLRKAINELSMKDNYTFNNKIYCKNVLFINGHSYSNQITKDTILNDELLANGDYNEETNTLTLYFDHKLTDFSVNYDLGDYASSCDNSENPKTYTNYDNGTIKEPTVNDVSIFFDHWYNTKDKIQQEEFDDTDFFTLFLEAVWSHYKQTNDDKSVLYGFYPQSLKAENVTILNESKVETTGTFKGYYKGSDGYYYAKQTANLYNNTEYIIVENGIIQNGKTYYFKVEPILWDYVDQEGATLATAEIASRYILDYAPYTAEEEIDTVVDILNTMYDKNFTKEQRNINNYLWSPQTDQASKLGTKKIKQATDYAIAKGIEIKSTNPESNNYKVAQWWTGSSHGESNANYVSFDGYVYGHINKEEYFGLVPLVVLKHNS